MTNHEILSAFGVKGTSESVYFHVLDIQNRFNKDVFIGDKYVTKMANYFRVSETEIETALSELINFGVIQKTGGKNTEIYGLYKVIEPEILELSLKQKEKAESDMPFESVLEEVESKPVTKGLSKINMLNAVISDIFPDCETLKDYMVNTLIRCGKFRVGTKTVEYLSDKTGISVKEIKDILVDLAYEIRPVEELQKRERNYRIADMSRTGETYDSETNKHDFRIKMV